MALRVILRRLHLYIAAFLVPFIFLMALSGGLDLLGIQGKTQRDTLYKIDKGRLDFSSKNIIGDVRELFIQLGINAQIDSIRKKRNAIYTRPSYGMHFGLKIKDAYIEVYQYQPDIIRRLMSLHKGNGSQFYKLYQKLMVLGLLIILLVGLWLGLASANTRMKTLLIFVIGIAVYLFSVV